MKNLALSALLLASPAFAAKAPNVKIPVVQNAPVTKLGGLPELKGKVVFLEFWATWCSPCVAGIPHMNRVIDAVKGEPVVFLSVTDEAPDMIATFRKSHEMKAWVGIDEKGGVLKAYHVMSRPAGYLIGKDGTLLASIFPDDLKEKDIRDALAGTFKPRPVTWETSVERPKAQAASAGKTYFEARISEASGRMGMESGPDMIDATSLDFASNIGWIWGVESDQVLVDTPPVRAFNFDLKTPPEGLEQGRELLKTAVQSAFGVRVVPETRETDALVLTLSTAPGAPRPKPAAEGAHSGLMASGGGRLLGSVDMSGAARSLWMSLGKPVVDETGLKGNYDFDLEWKAGDRAALDALLVAQGLSLVPGKRPIEFLRVTAAKP